MKLRVINPLENAMRIFLEKQDYAAIGEIELAKARASHDLRKADNAKIRETNGSKIIGLTARAEKARKAIAEILADNAQDYLAEAAPHSDIIERCEAEIRELRRLNRETFLDNSSASYDVLAKNDFLRTAESEKQEAWRNVERIAAATAGVARTPTCKFSLAGENTIRIEFGDSSRPSSPYYGCFVVHQDGEVIRAKIPAHFR